MKSIKLIVILLYFGSVTLPVFSQTNDVLNYLPADARVVIKINPGSLGQKIKWGEFVKEKVFEDLVRDVPEKEKDFLKDPGQTGIDLGQGIFLVMRQSKGNKKPDPVIYGFPKDTAAFVAMIKKLIPAKQAVKIPNGKMIINKNTALAWNREIFILTGSSSKEGSTNQTAKAKASAELAITKQLTGECKALLSKRPTALNNKRLVSLLGEEGDLLLWINNTLPSLPKKKNKTAEMFTVLNKNFMQGGDYTSGIIRFDNGKIAMQMNRYVSPAADSVYKKYPMKNLNTELLKKLPAGQPIFLGSFSISPEIINEMFTKSGADKYLDTISMQKIKIADILSAIKGDAVFAAIKVYEFTEEDSITQAMGGMQVFLTGHIGDKDKFKNLADLIQAKAADTTKNSRIKGMRPSIVSNDSFFVVSFSPIAAQKFLGSSGNEDVEKMIDPYKNYPSAFLIDLKTIFGFVVKSVSKNRSEEDSRQMSEVLGMFDKMIMYGGQYSNNALSSHVELTLTNKDENSLKQFVNLLHVFYLIGHKNSVKNQSLPDEEKKQ